MLGAQATAWEPAAGGWADVAKAAPVDRARAPRGHYAPTDHFYAGATNFGSALPGGAPPQPYAARANGPEAPPARAYVERREAPRAAPAPEKPSPPKKKRPRRKHGERATGVVRRRSDWDDHCLIEMDDGFEDVFCHRHRCQGKQLPEQGQIVAFKLHLSSKSLCWQSGFVTWEEGNFAKSG
eukprot:CAMPEP_0119261060 /NCGR_PEP_ID=MMETSP1329-20130426/1235_1 /TAXON_ID=114041 /ORGANISM="Genus nov. species nov., Strain RCC1024" /LENGTH=181 /DNA_ID=CAMNT_0007260557 /DNA_START=44 /DNA_END=585 /DNA_ORIENTATION=-